MSSGNNLDKDVEGLDTSMKQEICSVCSVNDAGIDSHWITTFECCLPNDPHVRGLSLIASDWENRLKCPCVECPLNHTEFEGLYELVKHIRSVKDTAHIHLVANIGMTLRTIEENFVFRSEDYIDSLNGLVTLLTIPFDPEDYMIDPLPGMGLDEGMLFQELLNQGVDPLDNSAVERFLHSMF